MQYSLSQTDNDIVNCTFSEEVKVDPRIYNIINHNIPLMLPCSRDLTNMSQIHYDALGTKPLLKWLSGKTFDKKALHELITRIANVINKIHLAGICDEQIEFDPQFVYVSDYDDAISFICIPVDKATLDHMGNTGDMLKKLVLSIKTCNAYELVGFVIEQVSGDNFELLDFINRLSSIYAQHSERISNSMTPQENKQTIRTADAGAVDATKRNTQNPELAYSGREYVPEGVSVAPTVQKDNGVAPANKTALLFSGKQDIGSVPYLSPVDNNTEEARIYLAGEKITIGRSSDCTICLNATTISSHHAVINIASNGCTITDLNSTNKTYVNGTPLKPETPVRLKHQDLIAFNKVRYRFFVS